MAWGHWDFYNRCANTRHPGHTISPSPSLQGCRRWASSVSGPAFTPSRWPHPSMLTKASSLARWPCRASPVRTAVCPWHKQHCHMKFGSTQMSGGVGSGSSPSWAAQVWSQSGLLGEWDPGVGCQHGLVPGGGPRGSLGHQAHLGYTGSPANATLILTPQLSCGCSVQPLQPEGPGVRWFTGRSLA